MCEVDLSSQTLTIFEPPKHIPKRSIHQRKIAGEGLRANTAIVRYDMETGSSIKAKSYCNKLDRMILKQSRLVQCGNDGGKTTGTS